MRPEIEIEAAAMAFALESKMKQPQKQQTKPKRQRPEQRVGKRPMNRKPLAPTKLASHDRKQQASNDERRVLLIAAANRLKALHSLKHREIAVRLAEEFQLASVPSDFTISQWLSEAKRIYLEDIKEVQAKLRQDLYNELEEHAAYWAEYICRDVEVQRTRKQNGELTIYIDEHAHKERVEAEKAYLAIRQRQAALLGLDLLGYRDDKAGGEMRNIPAFEINLEGNG